jgi:hypothetical protein
MIILSCGHPESNFDKHYNIMTKEWSREDTKAVGYRTVCLSCYKQYESDALLLYTDKEALQWMEE